MLYIVNKNTVLREVISTIILEAFHFLASGVLPPSESHLPPVADMISEINHTS